MQRRSIIQLAIACGVALAAAGPARAVDLFEGRLHVNGYVEEQIRAISRNFSEQPDLAQWYNVLNLELDLDILPDPWGPFSSMSAYARFEVRYDCVWTRACGLARPANTFGDRAQKVPPRLGGARNSGYTAQVYTGDRRLKMALPIDQLGFQFKDLNDGSRLVGETGIWNVPGIDTLFGVRGNDGLPGTADDPALYTFQNSLAYRFALRNTQGVEAGRGTQTLGPWLPANDIDPIASLSNIVNPFNANERNPITGVAGSAALPYRPAPMFNANQYAPETVAHGLYYPNPALSDMVAHDRFGNFDQNYSQNELAWNHGASQQDTRELKEAYLDMGFFEDRLFVRIGKQNIVWGKTELFRTTDQFNPQDIALSTLPSLEESRIALWAARAFYAFYEVGPLSDVRLEVAANLDHFEPSDLGRCGEAYTPNAVCDKTFGLFAHGLVGVGIAGETRPQDPWDNVKGLELGARFEFRWDRFSFAITDFWGYNDFPYVDKLWTYERNVDPSTGLIRRAGLHGPCTDPNGDGIGDDPDCLQPSQALAQQPANMGIFSTICSSSVGFSDLDRSVCAQSVFNSNQLAGGLAPIPVAISLVLGGNAIFGPIIYTALAGVPIQPVKLNVDPNDGPGAAFNGLSQTLSTQQEALLGCGAFFQTDCDTQGIDLLNAEASALLQSFVGFAGTSGSDWFTTDASRNQPGTVAFSGGPTCTRLLNGSLVILPGCHGPSDAGYNPLVDGTTTGLVNGVGQPFHSEMAALSYNYQTLLVALSTPAIAGQPTIAEFDAANPYRTNGCSLALPQYCSNVQAIFSVAGQQRNDLRAGGNGQFGRLDFVWHGGSPNLLRYDKRNVLGFSTDFAEDVTASNWSVEATWIAHTPYADNNRTQGWRNADEYNLTVSVDRPTFINFLNAGRTFFFNSQWFFQWIDGYRKSFQANGPFNVLATFTIQTGYFQDRLLPSMTFVYDFESNSGAFLPEIQYRFTENFSATWGIAGFWGRTQRKTYPITPTSLENQVGRGSYHAYVENGVAPVRDKDEVFFRLRYTF